MGASGRWGNKKHLRPALSRFLTVSLQACASPVKHSPCQPRDLGCLNVYSTRWHREGDKSPPATKHLVPVSLGGLWAQPSGAGRGDGGGAASLPGWGSPEVVQRSETAAPFLFCVAVCIVFLGTMHP